MQAIDDFILDRVVQPIFNKIGPHPSCFDVAKTALAGWIVFGLTSWTIGGGIGRILGAGILLLVSPVVLTTITSVETEVQNGGANAFRHNAVGRFLGFISW